MGQNMSEWTSFKVWPSYHEAIKGLPDEMRLALYDAIFVYGVERTEPNLQDPISKAIFAALRPNIDASVKAIETGAKAHASKTSDNSKAPPEAPPEAPPVSFSEPSASNRDRDREWKSDKNGNGDCDIKKDAARERERDSDFEAFWAAFPKKTGRKEAMEAFNNANASLSELLSAIEAQKQSAQWKAEGGRYIPNPASWLNKEGWRDVLPRAEEHSADRLRRLIAEGAFDDEQAGAEDPFGDWHELSGTRLH